MAVIFLGTVEAIGDYHRDFERPGCLSHYVENDLVAGGGGLSYIGCSEVER
jgi:hypothetical protein